MIAPAAKLGPAPRAIRPPETAAPDPSTVDAGEFDSPAARTFVDARIATALAARASTPDDPALDAQREAFDAVVRAEAETDREINALRDMAMDQIKQDDELLKKWIELI